MRLLSEMVDLAWATKGIGEPGVARMLSEANKSAPISLTAVTVTSLPARLSRTSDTPEIPEKRKRCTPPDGGGMNAPTNRSTRSSEVLRDIDSASVDESPASETAS